MHAEMAVKVRCIALPADTIVSAGIACLLQMGLSRPLSHRTFPAKYRSDSSSGRSAHPVGSRACRIGRSFPGVFLMRSQPAGEPGNLGR